MLPKPRATFKSRTSWREKLEKRQEPKIVDVPPRMQRQWGMGKMVIPRPLDVDTVIRTVPRGKLVTVNQIRERLAGQYGVDVACPLTTSILVFSFELPRKPRKRIAGRGRPA